MDDDDSIKGYLYEKIVSKSVLTDSQRAALGSVVVEATYLERLVEEFIWYLAGLTGANARTLTANLQLDARIDLMAAFIKERLTKEKEIATFYGLYKKLKVLTKARNTIVHGMWHFRSGEISDFLKDPEELAPAIARKPKRGSFGESTFPADKLDETAVELHQIRTDLLDFWYSVDSLRSLG